MSLLTSADEVQLAQDVVVTTLRSVLQVHGSEVILAQQAGITARLSE